MVSVEQPTKKYRSVSQLNTYNQCGMWCEVPGSGGMYEVSDQGQVRSWMNGRHPGRRDIPKILKTPCNPVNGYPTVGIHLLSGRKTRTVHALVCEVFLGPKPEGMEVRHLNGVRDDNRLVNLAYGTPLENALDKQKHGNQTFGEQHPASKLDHLQVKAIRALRNTGEFSYRDLSIIFKVSISGVRGVINGESWKEIQECITA